MFPNKNINNLLHTLKPYYVYIVFSFIVVIAFCFNGSISLWDQDESAYAGFAKRMIETGNWVIPEFLWSEIHRKPPLHFWNIALSYKIFGINEFSVRFPSAVFTILTCFSIFLFGKKFLGKKTALISTLVLSTTFFVPILAKISVTDATLLFFSTLCAFMILRVLQGVNTKRSVAVFWVSFALALLTKGPPIIIFTGVFAVLLFIFHPQRKNLFKFHPWFFLPLAITPFAYWVYKTIQIDGGTFINWMLDWYVLRRINGSVLGQTGPPGMHILLILAFFIPYLMFIPKAFKTALQNIKHDNSNLILILWFVSGWLIYEFSPSKLPAYCIVAHVPLAILIGKAITNFIKEKSRPHKGLIIFHISLFLLITVGLLGASLFLNLSNDLKWRIVILNIIIVSLVIVALKNKNTIHLSYYILTINALFILGLYALVLPKIEIHKNVTKEVANYLKDHSKPESTIILARKRGYPPSLPFYLSFSFNKVYDDGRFYCLYDTYINSKDPHVFVLSEKQKDLFLSLIPELKFHEVSTYYVDRKGKSTYYILMKNQGKLNQLN